MKKTAAELQKITKENERPLESILKQCEENAKQSFNNCLFMGYLSTERISELGQLGYMVRRKEGPMGESMNVISW